MRSLVCAAAVVAGACASPEDLGVETAFGVQPLAGDTCPTNTCGNGNSPVMDGVYFWQLHFGSVPSKPNPQGVQITGVQLGSMPIRLEVVHGDRLRGVHPVSGAVIADYTAVVGTQIYLNVGGSPYEIRVGSAAPIEHFWVGNQSSIWSYDLLYRPLVGPGKRELRPLCSEGDGDPNKISTIMFGGDLYDPDTKEITDGGVTRGWINIACADSAIFKMYKIGHASAAGSRAGVPVTSIEQRRAMLNAWTSNVCGTGVAFTEQGEPIKLTESIGMLPASSDYLDPLDENQTESIEAIWSEDGAVCLNTHRREVEQPGITDDLRYVKCGRVIETCDALIGDWKAHGHVLTGVPYPAP